MNIGILTLELRLHGCLSLKQKRQIISPLKDIFGKTTNIAVCEAGAQNEHQRSVLAFTCTASDSKVVEATLAKISRHCATQVDAEIIHEELEWL